MDPFQQIDLFEQELAEFTGAKYAVATDCCTHAIELAMRYDRVKETQFSAYTYLSVLMIFHHLKIDYKLIDDKWSGQYLFYNTRIIDSARQLKQNMYDPGSVTCVSFGRGKPLDLHRGGALLLDDKTMYEKLKLWRYDGRNLSILPWQNQKKFLLSFHYKMTPDEATLGRKKLLQQNFTGNQLDWRAYPDCREIEIYNDDPLS
jgi:dTDP-4-amino-4,6-dideoxygalactose transaminase